MAKCHNGPVSLSTKRGLHKQNAPPPATLVNELHYRHVNTTCGISITYANDECGNQYMKLSISPGLAAH